MDFFTEIAEECKFRDNDGDCYDLCEHEDNKTYNGINGSGFCLEWVCPIKQGKK